MNQVGVILEVRIIDVVLKKVPGNFVRQVVRFGIFFVVNIFTPKSIS